MKLEISRTKLLEALKRVGGVSDGRSTAILGNVLLRTEQGGLTLTTTNLDITLRTSTECDVAEPGETTIPMRRLEQIASVAPVERIKIATDADERMTIVSGEAKFTVAGMSAVLFPKLPETKEYREDKFKASDFAALLRKSAYAQSSDGTRKTLESVLLEIGKGMVRCVATDGRRLGYGEASYEGEPEAGEASYVIPSVTVSVLQRLLAAGGEVSVAASATHIRIAQNEGREVIFSKLVDGVYPDYRKVLAPEQDAKVVMDRNTFLDALTRVLVIAASSSPAVTLTFDSGEVQIDARGDDWSVIHERLHVKYDGAKCGMCFNPKYLQDALKATVSDEITMEMTPSSAGQTSRPVVLRAEEGTYYSLLMPLRLA